MRHCLQRRLSRVSGAGLSQTSLRRYPSTTPATLLAAVRHASSGDVPDRNAIWALWNEGNLFSLSLGELSGFLRVHCEVEVDPSAKKSALVRMVEEIMSSEAPDATVAQEDTIANAAVNITENERGLDFMEDADLYGDWGAETSANREDRKDVDYMELSPAKMGPHYDPLSTRAFQLMHESVSADVGLATFNPSKLPGQKSQASALVPAHVDAFDANKIRFRRGLMWCLLNLWNMNMSGELNIGAGKALYWREVAKNNRQVQPLWSLQSHMYTAHPFAWFAVAPTTAASTVESFASSIGMDMTQDSTTSYKLAIRKSHEVLDCELNSLLRCTLLNKPWDRFLMTHYIRNKMPDLRLLVRARHGIKKRVADLYLDADILRSTRDSVQSVLSPELGEVTYCCERVIRKWGVAIPVRGLDGAMRPSGVILQLVETKRTPLIVTKIGDEGTRWEYELIAKLPSQSEQLDGAHLADQLWEYGNKFAEAMEPAMTELGAFTMPSSAAFEPAAAATRQVREVPVCKVREAVYNAAFTVHSAV